MTPVLEALGDAALLLRWDDRIDAGVVARVQAVASALRAAAPAGVVDVVPAYASVAVFVDPMALGADASLMAKVEAWCRHTAAAGDAMPIPAGRLVEIPVHYGGEEGPDLAAVAAATRLAPGAVIARHAAPEYRVAMLGFAPGFPYLVGLDPTLATPRHAQPRVRVAAGSVGIGGAQTGIYPRASPGGWQIIGRTTSVLFDPARAAPSLLQPGDRVRFVPQ
jgi:KipI family sensor histidine kinase inhibitor